LDPALPAAWENSGVQAFIAAVPGDDWLTEVPGVLPPSVCGPGWAVQQDKVSHDGSFVWPQAIEYPDDNIGWPPIYDAQHTDLELYISVPDCAVEVHPPMRPPVEPRELAQTGGECVLFAAVGLTLVVMGAVFALVGRFAKRSVPDAVTGLVPMDADPRYKRK
jgi:hypothetical protein